MEKDILLQSSTELTLRLNSLEELLINKNIITKEEYQALISKNVNIIIQKIKEKK